MEKQQLKLYESEYRFMDIVWEHEPLKSNDLFQRCNLELGWKKSTVYTVLKKLETKGILQNNATIVSSLVKREQIQKYESQTVVKKVFRGSLPQFVAAFLDGKQITDQEAAELYQLIQTASEKTIKPVHKEGI